MRTQRRTNKRRSCPLCGRVERMYAPRWRAVPKLRRQRELLFPSARQKLSLFLLCRRRGKAWVYCLREQRRDYWKGQAWKRCRQSSTPIASADVRDRVYSQMLLNRSNRIIANTCSLRVNSQKKP